MPLGAGSTWPIAVDTDAILGPTTGITAGVTHLGDTGSNQGDQLGITRNLINAEIKLENTLQCGAMWSVTNGTFTQPAIAATVVVTVNAAPQGTAWMQAGMIVLVQPGLAGGNIGGYYLVTLVTSSTSITLLNLGVQGYNAAAAAVIPTTSVIQYVGWSGVTGQTDQVALYERTWDNSEAVVISAANINADWTGTFVGTGALAPDATAGDSTALSTPGLWQAITGATAASSVSASTPRIFIPSLTPIDLTFSVSLTALSVTATQEYTFGVGISTSSTAPVSNPFMGIGYKLNAAGVNWQAFAGATMGANTTSTGVVVAINTLYHLRMTLNQGWTSMNVWVNHAGPTTVTTNLQTGQMFPVFCLSSTIGTNSKVCNWARTRLRLYLPR